MKEGVKAKEPYMSNRVTSAETAAVGGAMTASGIAGNYGLDRMLNRKGVKTPGRALLNEVQRTWKRGSKTSLNPIHVPYVAGKIASRSLKTVGIPLAAYGAFNVVKPGERVVRINLKNDVIKPSLRGAAGLAPSLNAKGTVRAHRNREALHKADLSTKETNRLSRRKQQGRYLSLAAGTLGLGALALRAPELARAATQIPKVKNLRSLKRLASYDAPSTKASNALGIAAIGLGSVGSFNYAAQQKLERKQVTKAKNPYRGFKRLTYRQNQDSAPRQLMGENSRLIVDGKIVTGPEKRLAEQAWDRAYIRSGYHNHADRPNSGLPGARTPHPQTIRGRLFGRYRSYHVNDAGAAVLLKHPADRPNWTAVAERKKLREIPGTYIAGAGGLAVVGGVGEAVRRKQVKKAMTSRELDEKAMAQYVSLFPRPKLKNGEPTKEYHKRLLEWSTTGNTYAFSQRTARKGLAAQPYRLARIKRGPYLDGGQRSLPERRAYALTKSFSKVSGIGKRDDRFLREHRDRISPEAERGYEYLRSGRNRKAAESALSAGFAGLSAGAGLSGLRSGSKGLAALGGAGTGLSGYSAVRNAKDAKRWDSRMGKIKAKARERAAFGEYGRGRQVPVGKTLKAAPDELTRRSGEYARRASRQGIRDAVGTLQRAGASERLANRRDFFNKGLFPVPRPKLSMMPRRNSVRSSYTGTSRLGRKFTVSGSVR